jgi:hypothetical protein
LKTEIPPTRQEFTLATENPYSPPKAVVEDVYADVENNSGGGSKIIPPAGVIGWSWGAFLWNWIWAIFNKSWIGLLALVPYVGIVVAIYLGIKGRELAWRNKSWESVEHFNRVQRAWSKWALIIILGAIVLGILAAIALPAYQQHALRARGA